MIVAAIVVLYVLALVWLWAMGRAAAIGDARLAEQQREWREHARRR